MCAPRTRAPDVCVSIHCLHCREPVDQRAQSSGCLIFSVFHLKIPENSLAKSSRYIRTNLSFFDLSLCTVPGHLQRRIERITKPPPNTSINRESEPALCVPGLCACGLLCSHDLPLNHNNRTTRTTISDNSPVQSITPHSGYCSIVEPFPSSDSTTCGYQRSPACRFTVRPNSLVDFTRSITRATAEYQFAAVYAS